MSERHWYTDSPSLILCGKADGWWTEKAAKEPLCAKQHHSDHSVKVKELASTRVALQWERLHTAGCACLRWFWQNLFSPVSAEPASCMLPPAPTNSTTRVTQKGSLDLIFLAFSCTYTQCRAHHSSSMKIFLFDDKCSWQQQSQNLKKKKKFESTPPSNTACPTISIHVWRSSQWPPQWPSQWPSQWPPQWSRKLPANTVCSFFLSHPLKVSTGNFES